MALTSNQNSNGFKKLLFILFFESTLLTEHGDELFANGGRRRSSCRSRNLALFRLSSGAAAAGGVHLPSSGAASSSFQGTLAHLPARAKRAEPIMVREDGEDEPKDGGGAEDTHTSLQPLQTNGEQGSGGSARGLRKRNVAASSPSGYTTSLPNRHVYGRKVSQDMEKLATGNGMSGATSVRKHLKEEDNEPSEHAQ